MSASGQATGGLLVVHAHPDDETITTGATLAQHVAHGVPVTLITCTRGERGEVIPDGLAHLAAERAGDGGDALGAHREHELAVAMAALGVRDHRFLGADQGVRLRDSGMAVDGTGHVVLPADAPSDAFARAELDVTAALLAPILVQRRPDAVVTYDPGGGYGHPDHVQAHRVTMRAVELAATAGDGGALGWRVPRVYWVVLPRSVARDLLAALEDADHPFEPVPQGPTPSMVVPDEQVDVVVDAGEFVAAKAAALRAHATQVAVAEPYFALSNRIGQRVSGVEYFHLVRSHSVAPTPPSPRSLL